MDDARALAGLMRTLYELAKPTVALVQGPTFGGGIGLVACCDIVIAAETANFCFSEVKLGLLPGLGSTHWLPRLVGLAKAKELVLTARVILATEAAEIGLVNKVVPADQLMKEARGMAGMMAACKPEVLAAAKRALHFGAAATMEQAMRNEEAESAKMRAQKPRA